MYIRSLIIFIVLAVLSSVLYFNSCKLLIASFVWAAFIASLHFLMERTSKVSFYRAFFFGIIALAFLLELRVFFNQETSFLPYCHIGMAGNLLQTSYSQFIAIKNQTFLHYGALSIGMVWLLVLLINGGGFCSYVCFFGGIDDSLSRVLKKPLLKIKSSTKYREFQFALFIFLIIMSFLYGYSIFCQWLCPLKLSDSIINENSRTFMLQVYLFITVGLIFLLILPLITKKRFFCSTICPFGALPPLIHKLTPYKITIDSSSCVKCGKCSKVCPSFAIEKRTDDEPFITRFCTLCMRYSSKCQTRSIKQTLYNKKETILIPFVSMTLGGAISLFYVPNALIHVIDLLCSLNI